MSQFIIVDGITRELVHVVVKPTPGNPEGRPRLDYRDHMAPGEQTVEEAEVEATASVPAEWGAGKSRPGRPRKP